MSQPKFKLPHLHRQHTHHARINGREARHSHPARGACNSSRPLGSSARERQVLCGETSSNHRLTRRPVYDLTRFAKDHPGGVDVLTDCAGTEATESFDYAGHSDEAITTLQKFLVGGLSGSQQTKPIDLSRSSAKTFGSNPTSKAASGGRVVNRNLLRRLAVLAAGLGLVATLYWKLSTNIGRKQEETHFEATASVAPIHAFIGGLAFASSVVCVGIISLYSQFTKTLKPERDVFSYPPVIPRRSKR